jgi:hydrogenase-4 component E
MVSRMKAFTQVVGILAMENGVFLFASAVSGGMPFFAEIAVFFDVFISVIIMGIFVFRINKLFTHIDVDKLTRLRG